MPGTYLRCITCGHTADLLAERQFRCYCCGGLFDVIHDIVETSSGDWRSFFANRLGCTSGVWRFKQWIMPQLDENHIVSMGEGIVPIIKAGPNLMKWIGGDLDLWLILEGKSPTGSFKDFGMTVLVSVAKAAGVPAIACASTGDTSASLAAYCGQAGIPCAVILPEGQVTAEQILQVKLFGAKVIMVPGPFDEAMRILQELVANYGVYPGNSLNPARIEGHQATVFLVAQFFDWHLPDWFVVPVGNGSNCSSIGKALRLMQSQGFEVESRILGCQSQAANPLSKSWEKANSWRALPATAKDWQKHYQPVKVSDTIATAARIGDPVSRDKVMREIVASNGLMAEASEGQLTQAVLACAQDGIFICPQTGTALAGLRQVVSAGYISPNEHVVVVSTADGLKFTGPFTAKLDGGLTQSPDCRTESVAKIMGL